MRQFLLGRMNLFRGIASINKEKGVTGQHIPFTYESNLVHSNHRFGRIGF